MVARMATPATSSPRRLLALWAAAGAAALSSRLGRGAGTALPGLLAERIDPRFVAGLGRPLAGGAVLVTGTNGKTTTARLLAEMLTAASQAAVHNREGSNLTRGIASALAAATDWRGRPRDRGAIALMETDEATLPAAVRALQPRAVAFTNLFRDQLDRYGEVERVAAHWRAALDLLPPAATLVLNADDPSVAELALDWSGGVHWYSLAGVRVATGASGPADARWCRACGGAYRYAARYAAHLGEWRCSGCERARPRPDTAAAAIAPVPAGLCLDVEGLGALELPLSGHYNAANALAAIALARVLDLPPEAVRAGLAATRPAFGRGETVSFAGRRLRLLLCKNPAGATEALRLVEGEEGAAEVAFVLNDRFADGRDVSWIWDVEFERLAGRVARCWVAGERAEDAALRLRYAGWPAPAAVMRAPAAFLDALAEESHPGAATVLVTYTALLDLRAELARRGARSESTGGPIPAATA